MTPTTAPTSDHDKLLAAALASGLDVFARAGRLVVRGSPQADRSLVQALLSRKREVLTLLLRPTADEWEVWIERAAIAEFDGELSPCDAETLAWAELQERRDQNGDNSDATRSTRAST